MKKQQKKKKKRLKQKSKTKKRLVRLFFIVLIIAAALVYSFVFYDENRGVSSRWGGSSSGTDSSHAAARTCPPHENLIGEEQYALLKDRLSESGIVSDIPNKVNIALRFFSFEYGCRYWEKSYTLTNGNVRAGLPKEIHATVTIHSKYVPELLTREFCDVTREAKANDDLGSYSELSKTSLLWKFKSMLGYRECLGL